MTTRTAEHNAKIARAVSSTLRSRQLPLPVFMALMIDTSGGPDACHLWTGNLDDEGYGRFKRSGKHHKAHRVALELHLGRPIATGLLALHSCPGGDNPACCNPRHLREGDEVANANDALERHTACCGEAQWKAKLTKENVIDIRDQAVKGYRNLARLARRFGVSSTTIYRIVHRQAWRHI